MPVKGKRTNTLFERYYGLICRLVYDIISGSFLGDANGRAAPATIRGWLL